MAAPKHSSSRSFDPRHPQARRSLDSFRKLAPAARGQEPGHVRGRDRQRAHHAALSCATSSRRAPARAPLWFTGAVTRLAVVHGALRQLRRGGGRGARQGPGGHAAQDAQGDDGAPARRRTASSRKRSSRRRRCARATWWSSRRASSSPATARSSRASPRSTSRPSPASRRPSSARAAATARAVTGGTKVLSDRIVVRITADPGESFLDRMIALVEGAARQKTPNEIALHILLVGLTLVFLFACVTLVPLGALLGRRAVGDGDRGAAGLPDPDHHRRPAVGHRHRRHGPPAAQERASP